MPKESARTRLAETSNDAIAREVHKRWERDEPGASKPGARSIGAKVGLLRRGDSKWWRNQPGALRALAQCLGCTPEDIVGADGAGGRAFDDFPALRPLAASEALCRVGAESSLGDLVARCLHAAHASWIVVPPGWGKSLTIDGLRGRDQLVADRCAVLLDFARSVQVRPDAPAVFEIQRLDPTTDGAALAELARRHAPTIVLAGFEPPADAPTSWARVPWGLGDASWRERFVHWCMGRLGDPGQLDPDDFCDWLGIVDASGARIDSPGALLPLLAWAHKHGTPTEGPLVDAATALVRERLVRNGHPATLADTGTELLRSLALGAVSLHVDGKRPATIAEWRALLPARSAPAAPPKLVQAEVDALHRAGSKAGRDRHKAALEHLLRRDAREDVIEALTGCDLLVVGAEGLDIYPRWLADAYQRDVIGAATTEQSWEQWGRWAAHPDFRPAVVEALVAMERQPFLRLATHVLASDKRDLAHDAAIEALFEAAAYRLDPDVPGHTPWKPKDAQMQVLQRLGSAQAELVAFAMRTRGGDKPTRMTAPPDQSSSESVTWLARAWNYSLVVPAPKGIPPAVNWAFPGWGTAFHGRVHLPQPKTRTESRDESWLACFSLVRIARRLVKLKPEILDAQAWVPQVAALAEGIMPRAPLVNEIMQGRASVVLADVAAAEPEEVRARAMIALWNQLDHSLRNPINTLVSVQASPVRKLLRDSLPAAVFVADLNATATAECLMFQPQVDELQALPGQLREALFARIATAVVAYPMPSLLHIESLVADLDTFDTLATLAALNDPLGDAAARRGWSLDNERALVELERSLAGDGAAAGSWIGTCPAEDARDVAERVLRVRPKPGTAVSRWLANQIAAGSKHAPALYDLLVGLEVPAP